MSVADYQPIVEAINGLQSNPIKDYIFPVGTVITSAVLGIGATIYTNNFQDTINAEKHKLKTINNTTLAVAEMRDNLISIKSLYQGRLCACPIKRMLTIPPLVNSFSIPYYNAAELTFLTQLVGKDGNFDNRWIRVEIINTLFANYKSLIEQWMLFSKQNMQVLTALAPHIDNGFINDAVLFQTLGRPALIQLTDLTEKVLKLTDELIVELSCFLVGFPPSVHCLVKKSVTKKYGGVIQFQLPYNDFGMGMLQHVPPLDLQKMAELQQLTIEEVEQRYRYTYRQL